MKTKLIVSLVAAAWLAARGLAADAPAPAAAPPADQPAAFQSEALPPAGQANAAPRAARGGGNNMGAVTHSFTADELAQLHAKLDQLNAALQALKAAKADDDLVVDAEACAWMVETALRVPNIFGGDNEAQANPFSKCLSSLDAGLRRAQQIKDGTAAWPQLKGSVKRAYRSVVDGTAQPYTVSVPASYDPAKPTALYIYLHGMSHYVPDLGWDWTGGTDRPGGRAGANNYIRLECFGRGNNSFRWAGETDVLEALASVRKRYNIDPERIVLAGFSMGGAGSWQIGLHQPDLFSGLEIDAGVIGNLLNLDGKTPAQKAALATYGIMIPHAINITGVPLVGYAGANDAQLASSKSIAAQLVREGFHMDVITPVHSVGKDINTLWLANPGQGHSHATGETAQLINAFTSANFERGRVVPDQIYFVTYTTRYNHDFWITVDGMQQSFDQARVDATRDAAKSTYTITTANVSRLLLTDAAAAGKITIDGDTLFAMTQQPNPRRLLVRRNGHWDLDIDIQSSADAGLRKQHNLQGPVNDAFFDAFLCVTPTGQPLNAIAGERAQQELARFSSSFARDYCGDARAKADTELTDADIANNNLVLFGDPGSNKILARILDRLPLQWTKDSLTLAGKTYSAADHVPVMIYPNPLNPKRYIVINAGLSASRGGDAFGDFAVLKAAPDTAGQPAFATEDGGVFDEAWQVAGK